jgi:hypothetical protein
MSNERLIEGSRKEEIHMHDGMERRYLLPIYLPLTSTTDPKSPFVHNSIEYHLVAIVVIRQGSEGKFKLNGESISVCQIMHFVKLVRTFRNFHLPLYKPLLCQLLRRLIK